MSSDGGIRIGDKAQIGEVYTGTLQLEFDCRKAKPNATDINTLLADHQWLPDDDAVQQIAQVLHQAADILAKTCPDKGRYKSQLAAQLLGEPELKVLFTTLTEEQNQS